MRIIGLAGWSGSGKTTLLAKAIPCIVARGLKVSTLKHAHHAFDLDQPGKDSHTHRMAGATEVLVGSANRWALVHELRGDAEPALAALLAKLSPGRSRAGRRLQARAASQARSVPRVGRQAAAASRRSGDRGVASDEPLPAARVPVIDLDDIERVVDILIAHASPIDALLALTGQR